MTLERWLRVITGVLILITLGIAFYFEEENWLIVTAIFGLNLFQSGFTNWCPIIAILRLLGVKEVKESKQ